MPRSPKKAGPAGPRELRPEELRWICDPSRYNLKVSEREARLVGIIGQDRAIEAMKVGIELYSPGFNVFVCGIGGTGRTTTVKRILDNIKSSCPLPQDRAFVHNFTEPNRPRLIVLPRGQAVVFAGDMERFRKEVFSRVPRILESDHHVHRREKIIARHGAEGDRLVDRFDLKVKKEGFTIKRVSDGEVTRPELFPEIGGEPVSVPEIDDLVKAGKITAARASKITRRYAALRTELESLARETRKILESMETEVTALDRAEVTAAVREAVQQVALRHENAAIRAWLDEGVAHLAESVGLARPDPAQGDGDGDDELPTPSVTTGGLRDFLALFEVNVVLDNTGREKCPVVVESLPTNRRLFGWFEKAMDTSGHWKTDFRKIRTGSLLEADGGYLVLNAEDVLRTGTVWRALKRTLVRGALEIHEEGTPLHIPATSMTPEPIPINVKVILIGDSTTYYALYNNDRDFRKIFKILADFDYEMELTRKSLRQYAAFVTRMCRDEGLAAFEPSAMAAVAEYGARKAGRQGKLTARFGEISDLLREADYWRRKAGAPKVKAAHVQEAVRAGEIRNGLWEEKLRERVDRGQLLIDVKGRVTGQLNGLVIHDLGPHAFGLPSRITATAAPGTAGIINIEREARLSGSSHDKGILIIGGWFRERFGKDRAVNFTGSVAFEQSYGGIDGDSASVAEILALVSALSGLSLEQGIAVTGSVNQKGTVQPVGGINLKIEGFFHACRPRGLTGRQGVIIPELNASDLMLKQEVVEAVARKRFHIWPITAVEQAVEILTGAPAGRRRKDGSFPDGSVYAAVVRRLVEIARLSKPPVPQPPANSGAVTS
jgi:ATP-dependent Lon protease